MSKLVRDKIPEILEAKGIKAETRILACDKEYLSALNEKLREEVDEFTDVSLGTDDNHIKEELADVLEVVHAICKLKKYNIEDVNDIRKKKALERGGFEKRIFSIF